MTYSHNSVGNNNLKMTATTKSVHVTANSCSSSGGGSGGKQNNRRTSPTTTTTTNDTKPSCAATAAIMIPTTPISLVAAHSNRIASNTNQQLHPLMGGGSPSASSDDGSYFANQRKQQRQSPTYNGGGGAFFFNKNNNNNSGQFFPNNNNSGNSTRRSTSNKQQQRTPNGSLVHQSPAAMLGGGISPGEVSSAGKTNGYAGTASGRKRRPKLHLQSPIITAPSDLGVGGNISPTHPLVPTVLTHFAGSKCFDAPAPSAVPKPPQHWTQLCKLDQKTVSSAGPGLKNVVGSAAGIGKLRSAVANMAGDLHTCGGHVVKSSKRNLLDDFDTHNLKLLLNVQS